MSAVSKMSHAILGDRQFEPSGIAFGEHVLDCTEERIGEGSRAKRSRYDTSPGTELTTIVLEASTPGHARSMRRSIYSTRFHNSACGAQR